MQSTLKPKFTIVGGGIAGLTTAIALRHAGFESIIFEAALQFKEVGAGLGLGANAIKAFRALDMEEAVIARGRVLPSFTIYDEKGKPISTVDNAAMTTKYGVSNFTIHRAALQEVLLSRVDPGTITTNKRVADIEQHEDGVIIQFTDGTSYQTSYLIVADGIHSVIRQKLLPDSIVRYAGYTCWRGVIDNEHLHINATSETWGKTGRFGIVPLANKIYWFACLNAPPHSEQMKSMTVKDLSSHFANFHAPIPAILDASRDEGLIWDDISDLRPLPRFAFGNIILIGDAAHATTPNIGQGACMAIEDAVILTNELKKTTNIPDAFRSFEQRRMERVNKVVKTSRQIGQLAQMNSGFSVGIRNNFLRAVPKRINEKQLEFLYEVEF